jgi:uncharacterized repeat protein (TIGR01451 family)
VTFTVFLGNTNCTGTGANAGTVTLVNGVAHPSNDATVPSGGLSYRAHYNGDSVYTAGDGLCEPLTGIEQPPTPTPTPTPPVVIQTHPHIAIAKTPDLQTVRSGSNVTFTIVVKNDGDVTLTDVTVTDAQAPGCARTKSDIPALASMAPGATVSYACAQSTVTSGFINVAVATGTPPSGPNVTASDQAEVRVYTPAIRIVKTPDLQTIATGGTATFRITVTNTGNVVLTNVRVTDRLAPVCSRSLGTMRPAATITYTCTRPNVLAGFTNVAIVVGTPPAGPNVTDNDDAVVKTAPLKPPKKVVKKKKKPKNTG